MGRLDPPASHTTLARETAFCRHESDDCQLGAPGTMSVRTQPGQQALKRIRVNGSFAADSTASNRATFQKDKG